MSVSTNLLKNNNSNISSKDISIEINNILNSNTINDLNNILNKRNCLNKTNSYLNYLFHLVQASGILVTSIAISYNDQKLAWIGIGLNMFSSIINVYEKLNSNIMKKLLSDIKLIKNGEYLDEGEIIDPAKKENLDLSNVNNLSNVNKLSNVNDLGDYKTF